MSEPVIIENEDESIVIIADQGSPIIITGIGGSGSGSGPLYRGLLNYDGGHPDTNYGDQISLNGGGVSDPFYYPLQ